eukprot:TRINITY_DN30008_c0_g1_i1.p1 TRINITY_DN30008_c0_g1~~TRINITY_DN30008_c0_g1_i1.p1  ORF type:complete len:468 (+),score=71.28 TRINITY_DN30008_c0_g1_i1:46-1449(+)
MHRFTACLWGGRRQEEPLCEGLWLEDEKAIHPDCSGQRIFSVDDLLKFDGLKSPEIYISFFGTVYDVTCRPDMYGGSPPGPYHQFAGRECARALATMSMAPEDIDRVDLEDLTAVSAKVEKVLGSEAAVREAVVKAAREWQERFSQTYTVVGTMRGAEPASLLPIFRGWQPRPLALQRGGGGTVAKPLSVDKTPLGGPSRGPLELISRKPRAYLQRHFLGHAECQRLTQMTLRKQNHNSFKKKARAALEVSNPLWSEEEQAFLRKIEDRITELTSCPPHADEDPLIGTLTPAGQDGGVSDHLGLHVDTNAAHWRYCTAIVYLSSVSRGGETVFPAAVGGDLPTEDEERTVEAAGKLLELGVDHTDKAIGGQDSAGTEAAQILLASAASGAGIRVKPEEGTICLFWTRQDDGEIDRHSWHGGAPVPEGADSWKWTLQKFKEVPSAVRADPSKMQEFVRQSRRHIVQFS